MRRLTAYSLQVVLAFCINAAVTVCLAGYVYLFAEGTYLERCGGTTVDYLSRGLTHRAIAMTRTLISRILTCLAFFRSIGTIGRPSWDYRTRLRKPALQAICLNLGDTQLLTGTSILLALIFRSRHVSQYQYYVGSHLAVLSLVSHQATCLMITDKLEKMSLSMRIWRFFWTLALSAIVAFSIVIEYGNSFGRGSRSLGESVAHSIRNLVRHGYTPTSVVAASISLSVLLWTMCCNLILFFRGVVSCQIAQMPTEWTRRLLGAIARLRYTQPTSPLHRLRNCLLSLMIASILVVREILFSHAISLMRVWAMFAVSILDISVAAQKHHHQPAFEIEYSDDYRDNVEGEDMWEFGQILPLLLLVLPLTSFLDELLSSLTLVVGLFVPGVTSRANDA